MAEDYAAKPVLFLEYDVDDNAFSSRQRRWWNAHGGGSVTLPLVMVDSGNQFTNGYEDFETKYSAMVDASLARAAPSEIVATRQRNGDTLHFDVQVTNRSNVTLGASNQATVWAIVYEEFKTSGDGRLTNRFVRAAVSTSISSDLPPEASESFTVETAALSGVNWDNLRAVVLVDYRPDGSSGAYEMLQAVSVP